MAYFHRLEVASRLICLHSKQLGSIQCRFGYVHPDQYSIRQFAAYKFIIHCSAYFLYKDFWRLTEKPQPRVKCPVIAKSQAKLHQLHQSAWTASTASVHNSLPASSFQSKLSVSNPLNAFPVNTRCAHCSSCNVYTSTSLNAFHFQHLLHNTLNLEF